MSAAENKNSIFSLGMFLIATLMLAMGGLAIYYPQILQQYLPIEYLDYFSRYSWLASAFCVAGFSLHVAIMIYKLTRPRTAVIRSFKDLDINEQDEQEQNQLSQPMRGPIKTAGHKVSQFYTGKLVHKNEHVVKVKSSKATLVFLTLLLLSSVAASLVLYLQIVEIESFKDVLFPLAVSGGFFFIGLLSLYKFAQPMVFDRQSGYFWQGFNGAKLPNMVFRNAKPLTRIHALQVLPGNNRNSGFELNLVMTDRSRINLMEHRCPRALSSNANRLAEFLQVPVWR